MRILAVVILVLITTPSIASEDIGAFQRAWDEYQQANEQGRFEDAVVAGTTALRVAQSLEPANTRLQATLTYNLGLMHLRANHQSEAETTLQDALLLYQRVYGNGAAELIDVHLALGGALSRASKRRTYRRAKGQFEVALSIVERVYGENDPRTGEPLRLLGDYFLWRGRTQEAANKFRQAMKVTESAGPDYRQDYALCLFSMAKIDLENGRNEWSQEKLLKVLQIFESGTPDGGLLPVVHAFLVRTYDQLGNNEASLRHLHVLASLAPDDDSSEPTPIYRVVPGWPRVAQVEGKHGYVDFRFTIDSEGRVKDEKVISSSPGKLFVPSGLAALRQFRYKPKIVDGKLVDTPGQFIRLVWQLEGRKLRLPPEPTLDPT